MADGPTLTPEQAIAVFLLDAQCAQLQIAANQTGAALRVTEVGDALLLAKQSLADTRERLVRDWGRTVVVAQPSDVPRMVAP